CFNYVLDEATAEREFTRDQGFHFAREALSVQPVVGAPYCAGLLGRSPWMATEAPGYYRRWTGTVPAPAPAVPARPTPWAIRGLNWLLFPLMATYLQAVALRDNHRCRRAGTPERQFQVVSRPGQLEIRSTRFAQTAALFRPDPN
ncbi:MAG TPA: hypothetical protein VMH90_01275, partial [Thermoplasmata archaeon]|nr:hypothetical protein [Thermoplasmata archaeon]